MEGGAIVEEERELAAPETSLIEVSRASTIFGHSTHT